MKKIPLTKGYEAIIDDAALAGFGNFATLNEITP